LVVALEGHRLSAPKAVNPSSAQLIKIKIACI
jgi:hypothetical protein